MLPVCCVLPCYLQMRLVRRALDLARLQPGDQVLDVACGRGKSSHMASHRVGTSGRVLGLDLLPQVGWRSYTWCWLALLVGSATAAISVGDTLDNAGTHVSDACLRSIA